MRDYIYNRIVEAERLINQEIDQAKQDQAYNVHYQSLLRRVMEPMNIKTMPRKYSEQIQAIAWFTYKREISNTFIFPTVYKGRLYNAKWSQLKKEVQEYKIKNKFNLPYINMYEKDFTEGMLIPAGAPIIDCTDLE